MENAINSTKKSRRWVFILVALVAIAAAAGLSWYQSRQQAAENAAVEVEFVNTDQETENAASAEQQKQPQKKAVAEKKESGSAKESGSVLDKLKNVDIEVRGAKNPCTQTERMMKQCTD